MGEEGLAREPLAGRVVLEVGSGRGDTTLALAALLDGQPGARLIATDAADVFFNTLREAVRDLDVDVTFLRTPAQELAGIDAGSIDYVVCNYTLCAVNASPGLAAIALHRFWEVLRPGGKLFVEEELPVGAVQARREPDYRLWARKWRLLKAATVLAGGSPFNEMTPETLVALCRLTGFEASMFTLRETAYPTGAWFGFFRQRLERSLVRIDSEAMRAGFLEMARTLEREAEAAGEMKVPVYELVAVKGSATGDAADEPG